LAAAAVVAVVVVAARVGLVARVDRLADNFS
jgi:hypothetical protein